MDEFVEDYRLLIPLEKATTKTKVDQQVLDSLLQDNAKPNQLPDHYIHEKEEAQWDCETVVSTYSNLENHPKLLDDDINRISKIRLSKKTGIALGTLENTGRGTRGKVSTIEEEDEEEYEEEKVNLGVARSKKETKAEKAARKNAVEEEKRRRREEKKGSKQEFKKE